MKYLRFTAYATGKPLWLREDQLAAWYFERGHYHLVPVFDEVDLEVKEGGEEILAIAEGRSVTNGDTVSPLTIHAKRGTLFQRKEKPCQRKRYTQVQSSDGSKSSETQDSRPRPTACDVVHTDASANADGKSSAQAQP